MDTITTAIVTAVANHTVKDCYKALKNALMRRFGEQSDLIITVNALENKPNSEGYKVVLKEEVENNKVNNDPELVKLAQDLLAQIKEQPGGQESINQAISNVKYAATSGTGTASIGSITEQEESKNN